MHFEIKTFPTPELAKSIAQRKREASRPTPYQLQQLRLEQEAERQAELRAKRKALGLPDPRLVDRALVAALRSIIRRSRSRTDAEGRVEMAVSRTVNVEAVVLSAGRALMRRGYSAASAKIALMHRMAAE